MAGSLPEQEPKDKAQNSSGMLENMLANTSGQPQQTSPSMQVILKLRGKVLRGIVIIKAHLTSLLA